MTKVIIKTILLILTVVIVGGITISLLNFTKRDYIKLLNNGYNRNHVEDPELIKASDLDDLLLSVREYLKYVGVVGKEKVYSFTIDFTGEFKMNEDADFSNAVIEQTSYIPDYTRLFYMELKYNGLNVVGLHHYENSNAIMRIKLFDLIKVADSKGELMNQAELVTMFNDLALFAPQGLIDSRITWQEVNDYEVIGTITNGDYSANARFIFNENYQLINFISSDRYYIDDTGEGHNVDWSTPITEYQEIDGLNLPYKGSAIWHFDDHDYEYVKLTIEDIIYNKNINLD
jgi:hypothetical protein